MFFMAFSLTSCHVVKQAAGETFIESVQDPKSGAQVFTRDNENTPYGINVGGIVKARKQAKKAHLKEELDKY